MAAQDGVMSYAVSLQMQCYMFIVGHLDELPSDVIALLPIGIRCKLLLMLPALDICKLEETPVTDGISMDDEIWKLKYNEQSTKFCRLVEDMTLTWKDSYICDTTMTLPDNLLLLPNIYVPVEIEYKCTAKIQGLNFVKSGRAALPDRYKTYHHCSSELLKLLVDSNISFKAIDLEAFLIFVGFEIPVECVPLLEMLLNSVIALEITIIRYIVHNVTVAKLLSIIFTNPCQVKYLTVDNCENLQFILPFITNNPHCKLKNIKLGNRMLRRQSLDMLYCILDSQDELEKLHCKGLQLENFKYSIFSRPTFKELTISDRGISMDSYVYIMQQFFLSPYPVTLKLYGDTISGPRHFQISSVQSHPTQHSKTLELSYYYSKTLESPSYYYGAIECLPSTVHLKKLVLEGAKRVKCFSMLDNITVDECISVSTDNMDDLNDLFHITTAKEWNINVALSESTKNKFIVALTNIKGVVTKLCIDTYSRMSHTCMSSIAEAIFTSLQSSLSQLELDLSVYSGSHVRQLYDIWKQCGSIQLKKLKLIKYRDNDDTVRDIVALISNDFMY